MDMDASRLRHLVQCLRNAGAADATVADVLARSGLSPKDIDPARPTYHFEHEVRFVREACDALGDVTFGARSGLSMIETNSVTAYIRKFSKNLQSAIEITTRFDALVDPALAFALRISSDAAIVEMTWKDASYARFHRHTEWFLFGIVARMRGLTQTNLFPIEIRFDHKVGKSLEKFRKIAGCPVVFGAERPEIVLSRSALQLPIPTYDPSLQEHLIEYGQRLLNEREAGKQILRARVESVLLGAIPKRVMHADEVAAKLGMSPRTFARRLREGGESYRDIVDDLRCDLAKTFMKDEMSLTEIAYALGYADQASFSTAFKRWTGTAPSSFRRAH